MTRAGWAGALTLLAVVSACGGNGGPDAAPVRTPRESSTSATPGTVEATPPPGVKLDSCSLIPVDLVNRDLGSRFTDGTREQIGFQDPAATDCDYSDGFGLNDVLITATTRADTDLTAAIVGDVRRTPRARSVPGADRSLVVINARHRSGRHVETDASVDVVKGQLGFSISIDLSRSFTMADLQRFARDVLAAIEARP